MMVTEFKRLKTFENEDDLNELEIGDRFLYGTSIIQQKESKGEGQPITYYEVIGKSHNGIEYTPIYDYMEKGKGDLEL